MKSLSPDQIEWFVNLLRHWGALIPSVKTLMVMIGLDIAAGWLVAIAKHTLNSTTSFAGMCKKAMVLLLVAVAIILEPYANGLPLSMLISLGFIGMEGISILENAAVLGVPLPPHLVMVLEKLQSGKKERIRQKSPSNAAMSDLTAALNTRIEQTQTRIDQTDVQMHTTQQVRVVEPVKTEIINTPDNPANVAITHPTHESP